MLFTHRMYYFMKPIIPRRLQLFLRRKMLLRRGESLENIWPIYAQAGMSPENWTKWPGQKQFALVLTHDVETDIGQGKCYDLASMEKKLGFRSSFYFVPERYTVSTDLRQYLTDNGFEIGVHGLFHDGRLFESRRIFRKRATQINHYLNEWRSAGFRSPAMHHNLDWLLDLNIEYDASTFDTDPFEPQPDGMCTIFPFWVQGNGTHRGYVELPYTLAQDFTLFVLMKEKNIDIWKHKLDWVVEKGGMALMNTHPDYMNFSSKGARIDEYPAKYYEEFLEYIRSRYDDQYWHALPRDMANFWSQNITPIP